LCRSPAFVGVARPLREQVAGGVYHVFSRGVDRRPIFADDADRRFYLGVLGGVVAHLRWRCLSYCLMPNHVHLLIELREPNLARGMQRLHGGYAREFNERHQRRGHLFESRYGSVPVRDDPQLLAVVRYIARNPLEAGLCEVPEAWEWSSHGALAVDRPPAWLDHARVRAYLAAWSDDADAAYAELVAASWG